MQTSNASLQVTSPQAAQRTVGKWFKRKLAPIPQPKPSYSTIEPSPAARTHFCELAQLSQDYRAWLGASADKYALVDSFGGFILHAQRRLHWIALAGPMGKTAHSDALLGEFFARAKSARAEPVFYQADAALLAQVTRVSQKRFHAYKLGAEALVDLAHFSLEGNARAKLRTSVKKAARDGLRFELVANADANTLAQCQAISDQWLSTRKSAEKQFSLGAYSLEYLHCMPLALVWQGAHLIAFANVLQSANLNVLSIDLMRQCADAPSGAMDYLFCQLMFWGKAQGYAQFSLGMSPMQDIAADKTAPSRVWPHVARAIARHGERYYHFHGLRRFKEKWQPDWQPRYVLLPHRLGVLPCLLSCAIEIAGGKRKLIGGG
jgi:phosphatidylglycerol lysyltransferase